MASQGQIHGINFSRRLAVNTIFFLIPLHFLKIGFNGWQIGIIVSLFGFAPLLFSFPTGWINDRLSINRVIQASLLALALVFFITAWVKNFYLMLFMFLFLGIANNAMDVSLNSLYYKDERVIDLNRKYGVYVFWLSLGNAVGTLLGGILLFYTNFKTLFLVYALFLLSVLVLTRNLGQAKFDLVSLREYKHNILNRKTILFGLLVFILALHWGVEGTVYSPFLKKFFELNTLQVGLYISIPLFVLALAAFLLGRIRYDTRLNTRIFLFSMFLSGLGHILMVNRNVYLSFLFRVVHECGDGFLGALIVVSISRLFEKRSIGGSSGILISIMTFGHMAGALFFSPLGYRLGLQYPFIISGLLLIANTAFSSYVLRRSTY